MSSADDGDKHDKPSIAELSLGFTGIFEAELLVMLMLREWKHPLAADRNFHERLLESAAEVLRASISGEELIGGLAPENVNLVAAICFAEATALSIDQTISPPERQAREAWIEAIRRSLPSCFCDPDLLS